MAFTEQENQLVKWGLDNGKSTEEITLALSKLRAGIEPTETPKQPQSPTVRDRLAGLRESILPNPKSDEEAIQSGLIPVKGPFSGKSMYLDPSGSIALSTVGRGIKAVASKASDKVFDVAKSAASAVTDAAKTVIPEKTASGVAQTATDLAERIPRFVGRVREGIQESAQRAERIRASEPVVQTAIKSNLDDRIIRTVEQADRSTASAYKEIIDIAENTGNTLRVSQRPEIVAGKAAEAQYKLIDTQRKTVGKQIGEAVRNLSKTTSVDMTHGLMAVDDVLGSQGIKVLRTKAGTRLDFTGSRFTPAERTKIQQLYDLATEGGRQLSPAQVHGKDQLFSKLQRESRFEGIGDIIVETEHGNMSLFRVFRDMYANMLDQVSPDDIRALNRQYRNLSTLVDDIENSIVKSGNFEATKNVDAAEFAQTNLRRVLSDAQSAAAYREILEEMDTFAREFGYTGARADDLIAFATEIRKLYDTAIPAASFQGGIRAGLSDVLQTVANVGKPTAADQRKALRALIESRLGETVQ